MHWFDLMSSEHFHVILHSDKKHGLIFNRLDDTVATINYDDAKELSNLKKVGRVYGIVGHYLSKYLVLIKSRALVGIIYDPRTKREHEIYVITQVQVVDVSCISNQNPISYEATFSKGDVESNELSSFKSSADTNFEHGEYSSLPVTINTNSYNSMRSRATPWNPFRLASSLKPRMPAHFLRSTGIESSVVDGSTTSNSKVNNASDESDKRLIDEMVKLFNNTNSFYFSPTLDLTNRLSKQISSVTTDDKDVVDWRIADERFFWNRYMLRDLINLSEQDNDANLFIRVILQGYIAIENLDSYTHKLPNDSSNPLSNDKCDRELANEKDFITESDIYSQSKSHSNCFQLALISRRSVFHAGTRYKRRGCDESGNCANFVETEQILRFKQHFKSIIILRGSIPLFWYQSGYNYRPPPVLYRNDEENHAAFTKHFESLFKSYETGQIISIDCTEHTGREKGLHDAFRRHMEQLKKIHPRIQLIEFDFHKHCRGRQCTDLQVENNLQSCGLTEQLMKDVRYYWNDGELVWTQGGVFRVNCLDCSDRTNVVQRALALRILDNQLLRLGIISPDSCQEDNVFRKVMQVLWSTNGNVLSTQYCGTRALFTGDRKLSGYLKDTYSSASRYYISKFRDVYRQAAIDAMLGVQPTLTPDAHKDLTQDDHYELMSLDPILVGRSGSALLRDVSSRVTDRFARLKDRFYVKPLGMDNMELSKGGIGAPEDPEFTGDRLDEALEGLSIDWPSNENVTNTNEQQATNIFNRLSHSDDSFQDDEFGQLMLSIDLAELQRLRDDENKFKSDNNSQDKKEKAEEINMTEACAITNSSSGNTCITTSTTST